MDCCVVRRLVSIAQLESYAFELLASHKKGVEKQVAVHIALIHVQLESHALELLRSPIRCGDAAVVILDPY